MGSKSSQATNKTENTQNIAVSRDAITQDGTQILDSIIVDPSDKVMVEMINGMKANWEVMISGQKASLSDITSLGKNLLELAGKNQIEFRGMAQDQLNAAMKWAQDQMANGKYIMDISAGTVDKSFDFAGKALGDNSAALQRALEITADVKTGDFAQTMKALVSIIALFSPGAIYLARD